VGRTTADGELDRDVAMEWAVVGVVAFRPCAVHVEGECAAGLALLAVSFVEMVEMVGEVGEVEVRFEGLNFLAINFGPSQNNICRAIIYFARLKIFKTRPKQIFARQ
jgi:hypothetical protein